MFKDDDFAYTDQITSEQVNFVNTFFELLFDDEKLNEYWDVISDIDKAMAFGYHDANAQYGNRREMIDTILELRDTQRKMFAPVMHDYGVSKTVRYSHYGEAYIYIFENVQVPRVYITPTEAKVYPLRLMIDAKWENKTISAQIKARVYDDSFRSLDLFD